MSAAGMSTNTTPDKWYFPVHGTMRRNSTGWLVLTWLWCLY